MQGIVESSPISNERLAVLYGSNKEIIARILAGFIANVSDKRVAELRCYLDAGDLKTLSFKAHSLKGAAGTVGAGMLQAVANEIELAAGENDSIKADSLLTVLKDELERVIAHIKERALP